MKLFLTTVATLAVLSSASQPIPPREKKSVEASTDKETVDTNYNDHGQVEIKGSIPPSQEKICAVPPRIHESRIKAYLAGPAPKITANSKPGQKKNGDITKYSKQEIRVNCNYSSSSSTIAPNMAAPTSTLPSVGTPQKGTPEGVVDKDAVKVNPFVVGEYKAHPSNYITKNPILMKPEFWRTIVQRHFNTNDVKPRVVSIMLFNMSKFKAANPGKYEHLQFALKQVKMEDYLGKYALDLEYNALKRLKHPNIVRCYGIQKNEQLSTFSLVMEGNTYGSIEKLVERKSPMLTVSLKKKFLLEVYNAMKYMHSVGIVHRDIKLENLIIMTDGMIRIIDFGLALVLPARDSCIPSKRNPANIAPEVYNTNADATIASDLWSFGVLIVDMLGTNSRLKGYHPHVDPNHPDSVYMTIDAASNATYLPEVVNAYPLVAALLQVDPKTRAYMVDEATIEDLLSSDDDISKTAKQPAQKKPYAPYVQQPVAFRRPTQLGSNSSMKSKDAVIQPNSQVKFEASYRPTQGFTLYGTSNYAVNQFDSKEYSYSDSNSIPPVHDSSQPPAGPYKYSHFPSEMPDILFSFAALSKSEQREYVEYHERERYPLSLFISTFHLLRESRRQTYLNHFAMKQYHSGNSSNFQGQLASSYSESNLSNSMSQAQPNNHMPLQSSVIDQQPQTPQKSPQQPKLKQPVNHTQKSPSGEQ